MKTKTLLIAAAALAAGVISSQAQVYSQNIVGYVNVTLPAGYTLVDVALSPNSSNNAEALLPSLQVGDQILVWNGGGYNVDFYSGPGAWLDGATFAPISQPLLASGVGFFFQNNNSLKTNTFVGNVVLSNTVPIVAGYSLVGSTAPVGGSIESTNFNIPLQVGDQVLVWNGGGYNVDFFSGPGAWLDGATFSPIATPNLSVGQGFYYQNNNSPTNWVQNVVVH